MTDGVNTPAPEETPAAAPLPGTPEHDAEMAQRYNEANTPADPAAPAAPAEETPADPPAEELIGGKFKSQEELLAAYEELAAKQAPAEETPAEGAEETPAVEPSAELNGHFEKAAEEFETSGDIGPETREALVKSGIPETFINTYLEGVRAQSAAIQAEAHGLVGGKDNWDAMMKWAESLPEKEVTAFNNAVANPDTSSLAIQGLYARYSASEGAEKTSITAGADHAAIGGDTYKSRAEMTADMRDPRYAKDPAFREGVASKIARSRKAGTLDAIGITY